jgi:deazaflavin-dependent oxidoreductase (nitroreductase family)
MDQEARHPTVTSSTPQGGDRLRRLAVLGGAPGRALSGRRWFPLYGVLHHVGRHSGREYATPVVIRLGSDATYVPLPFGERTQWYRNVLAAGGVRATWKGRDQWLGNPALVASEETADAFHPAMRKLMRLTDIRQVVRFDPPHDGSSAPTR